MTTSTGTTPPAAGCLVCRKHRDLTLMPGGPVADDDLVVVSHLSPRAPGLDGVHVHRGHLLVEPRRHVPGWADLTDEEAAGVGRWCARASRALLTVTDAERVYTATIGHGAPHLHVHLVPRYPQTPPEYPWHDVDSWPGSHVSEDHAADLVHELRRAAVTARDR